MSFTLTAGACCLVTFSNVINGEKTSSPTLNINSTGSKTMKTVGYRDWNDHIMDDWTGVRIGLNSCLPALAFFVLATYDGTYYRCCHGHGYYSDYSD